MAPTDFVELLVQGQPTNSLPKPPAGAGAAFFDKVLLFYGSAPAKIQRLGHYYPWLINQVDDVAWVWRSAGIVERLNGNWKLSADCFIKAGETAKTPQQRASFAVGAIDSLARNGDIEAAESLGKQLASRLKRLGEPGLAARALFNLGNALVYQDRMPEARKALLQGLPGLVASGHKLEAASAKMALSSTYLYGGDPRLALQFANEAIEEAEAISAEYLADLARLNVALAHLVLSNLETAYSLLQDLRPR
ncbi:MAG TPA: hypothetical protein VK171_05950, partial [Fimbriimonas sp.]|nr:hypothetical protein [Fimbriimonas sp.]